MLGSRASVEMKARITEELGLNDPIPVQLATFFGRILQGNLGTDMWSQRPVTQIVLDNLPYTLVLIAVGPRLGGLDRHSAWAATRRSGATPSSTSSPPSSPSARSPFPPSSSRSTSSSSSAIELGWLPVIGAGERGDYVDQALHLIMPAFALGLGWVGYLSRIVRASMLEVMGENHIRTARAFGLPEYQIVKSYALRIAILPTITLLAVAIGGLAVERRVRRVRSSRVPASASSSSMPRTCAIFRSCRAAC